MMTVADPTGEITRSYLRPPVAVCAQWLTLDDFQTQRFSLRPPKIPRARDVFCFDQTRVRGRDIVEEWHFVQSAPPGGSMPDSPKPRILVVDDDPRVRESLGMLLTSVGYEVGMANNGVSAVAYLEGSLPDLIVSDLDMPEMSGMELISHVRRQYPAISIVAMSGGYQGAAVPASIVADRFYPKGEHPQHLLTAIASLIAANPARRRYDELPARQA